MKHLLKALVPTPFKQTAARVIRLVRRPLGWVRSVAYRMKNRGCMIPPGEMSFVGAGPFEKIGSDFVRYFVELGGLKPAASVLDIGCGIGRMAIPLTDYLSTTGTYDGFDIVASGIRWCRKRISTRFPNFHFQRVDVYNKYYNRRGRLRANELEFPYEDGCFDFAFATSVFTHMLPLDVDRYLSETARVLKSGGTCLITFFLINEESEELLGAGRSALDFSHVLAGCRAADPETAETAVAYHETSVHALLAKNGLDIVGPVHYGDWCGRERFLSYQDIVVARKVGAK